MVDEVEADLAVQPATHEVGSQLPQVGVDHPPTETLPPKQRPAREIKVNELDPWKRFAGEGSFDSPVPVLLGQHPDIMEPRGLQYPVPAVRDSEPLAGFAGIGRKEDFHIRVMYLSRCMDRIRKKSMRTPIRT